MSETEPGKTAAGTAPQFDDAQVRYALERLRDEQNLTLGSAAAALGALLGALVWAVVTVVTKFQIGFMAIGVGLLVGLAMRQFGKGIDKTFGVVAAVLALFGCALGNLFAVCGLVAAQEGMSVTEVLSRLDAGLARELMLASFRPMDLLFYAIAVYEAYKVSFRSVTGRDIAERITGQRSGA